MKFLVDANLPRPLVEWLTRHGDEAHYVDDLLTPPAADDAIWRLATANEFIIVSKDSDFADRAMHEPTVRVIWVRCGNLKLGVFEAWFAARRQALRRLLSGTEQVIELR